MNKPHSLRPQTSLAYESSALTQLYGEGNISRNLYEHMMKEIEIEEKSSRIGAKNTDFCIKCRINLSAVLEK